MQAAIPVGTAEAAKLMLLLLVVEPKEPLKQL